MVQSIFKTCLLAVFASSMMACSPETPKLIPKPEVRNDKVSTDSDAFTFTPKVDILFVIDNSGSMGSHQNNLAANINQFVQSFSATMQIDYNVGVVSTDMSDNYHSGRLQGQVRFVNRLTPNGLQTIASNILGLGTSGDWQEKSFDPVVAALSAPLITGFNAGFYRQDAHLAVIFITDAEDQSEDYDATSTFNFLTNLKANKDKVLAYGVIVPSAVSNCSRDDMNFPSRIENFLAMPINAGKNVMNLCDSAFGTKLADLSKDIAKYVGGVIYLNRAPVVSTIKVTYGSQIIPPGYKNGWSFDPSKNAIVLGDDIQWSQQPAGTKVQVYFEAAQYESEK